MFTGWFSRGSVGLAAAVMAPVAFACENPDNITYTLRSAPPVSVSPGEFVLEVDVASRKDVEEAPIPIMLGEGDTFYLPNVFAVFDVKQVRAGDFAAEQVRIPYWPDSCSSFSQGADAAYFVSRWEEAVHGLRRLIVVPIKQGEVRAQHEVSQKAAN